MLSSLDGESFRERSRTLQKWFMPARIHDRMMQSQIGRSVVPQGTGCVSAIVQCDCFHPIHHPHMLDTDFARQVREYMFNVRNRSMSELLWGRLRAVVPLEFLVPLHAHDHDLGGIPSYDCFTEDIGGLGDLLLSCCQRWLQFLHCEGCH